MSALSSGPRRPGIIIWLAFVIFIARSAYSAPVHESDSTQVAEYDGGSSGCYYNFQHYDEGARIITNEPCLNCTCHNRMLMCYLRVCPFSKAIGQDCTVEKRPDQCCPVITCPDLPVQLLTSTTTSPSSSSKGLIAGDSSSSTELGFPDTYGCNVHDRFYADGAQLPLDLNNPCELCYCIRNKTTCLMQQCTLSVAGCKPVYQPGICCPVKYNCDYEEVYESTSGTTPALIMTTTLAPRTTPPQCHYEDRVYADGELIYTIQPCRHCYCFHGDIVCAVQECDKPMEYRGKNCTALPPLEGECCPSTYNCDGFKNITTEIPENEDNKDMPQESTEKEQESFPGADNAIPEEIPQHISTTEKLQTISSLGNEIPESEPTKSTIAETMITQESYTTIKPESDESAKPVDNQPTINSSDSQEVPISSVEESSKDKEIAEGSELPITKSSNEISLATTDKNISDYNKEADSKDSNVIPETSTQIISDSELTIAAENKPTQTSNQELTSSVSPSSEPPISDEIASVDSSESNIITTEKELTVVEKENEKSSELSSPSSEVTTEQSISKEVTEATFSTSSTTEYEEHTVDIHDENVAIESEKTNKLEPTSTGTQDKQVEEPATPKYVSVAEHNQAETTVSSENVPIDNNQFIDTATSINTESDEGIAETSTIYNRHDEFTETKAPISVDVSTEVSSNDAAFSDKNKIFENTDAVTSESSPISISIPDESVTTEISQGSKITEISTSENPLKEEISEKEKPDEMFAESTTETHSYGESVSKDSVEESDISGQGSTDIPAPSRVAEHKAEDKDAVTEGYIVTSSGMPHKIENLHTEPPEPIPTTYLPPVGSSTETERQPSTPLYEDLPKEEPENDEQSTELSITPTTLSHKTTVNEEISGNDNLAEKKESIEPNTNSSVEEINSEQFTSSLPEDHTVKLESDNSQNPLDLPIPEKTEQSSTDLSKPEDKLELNTEKEIPIVESTTIFVSKEDHSESVINVVKNKTEVQDEKEGSETTKETITTQIPFIENPTSENTSENLSIEKVADKQESANDNFDETKTEINKDIEFSTQASSEIKIDADKTASHEIVSTEKEKPEISFGTEVSSTATYTESPEISIPETKLNDQNLSKETLMPESETRKPIEEKLENNEPQLSNAILTTPDKQKTESSTNELPPAASSSEISIEQTKSTQNVLKKEEESSHSTESSIPYIEIESHEIRPAGGIPGEGNCLVDGQSYNNNSAIPPANACQLSCLCVSSIVQCELVQCPPPPTDLPNCISVQPGPETCCPMYTCDSIPNIELEADNQKADQHTASEEVQTTQKTFIEESTYVAEITTVTDEEIEKQPEVSVKLQSDSTEFTSEKSDGGEILGTPVSPVERETESPTIMKDISTSETPKITFEKDQSHKSVETNDVENQTTLEGLESIPTGSTQNIKDLSDRTKTELESDLQNKDSVLPLSTESEENVYTEIPNVDTSTPTLTSSSTLKELNIEHDQTEVSTLSSTSTEAELKEFSSEKSTLQFEHADKSTENDISEVTTQIIVEPKETQKPIVQSTEKSVLPEESEISSTDITELSSSATEENLIEKEIQNSDFEEAMITTLSPESIPEIQTVTKSSIIPEKESNEITHISQNTEHPEEIQLEYSTEIPENQFTDSNTMTIKPNETADNIKEPQDHATEKTVESEEKDTQESSSAFPISTEDNATIEVITDKPEEESFSIPSASEPDEKTSSVTSSEEPADHTVIELSTESNKSTPPTVKDVFESISEKELVAESSSVNPEISETSESFYEKSTEETPVETQPEKTEEIDIQNITEKSTEESTKLIETSEESKTPSQEHISSAAEDKTKIELTDTSLEHEKETLKPDTERTTEIKISTETENPVILEDKKEILQTTESTKLDESTSLTKSSSPDYETEKPLQPTIDTTLKLDQDESMKNQEKEVPVQQASTTESTKIEFNTGKGQLEITNESPDKEFTALGTSSEEESTETSLDNKHITLSTESVPPASSPTDLINQKLDEEKEITQSNGSEELPLDSGVSKETQTTISHDLATSTEISDVTRDDQYHFDSQQTEDSILHSSHDAESQGPTEPLTTSHPLTRPKFPDQQVPETEDENIFPPDNADIKNPYETDYTEADEEDDQINYGPGTCRYSGKIYMSAQQIPREDPCDFCFCFRSDIICLQQSCPPPISGCHEEPIGGFCCPRYECPVSMAMSLNLTTTTTTTTTTLPPTFLSHAYKGQATRGGCQIGNRSYRVGEDIKSKSNSCRSCKCGGNGQMKCEPKACSAGPVLKEMIAASAARRRRR